ncbi:MAG: (d)CMP kinase [Christensenellales bacterium]
MINIAIDGPAGAGKSTIAKLIAKKKGYIYLDTGAMYRAIAVWCIKSGVDVNDEGAVSEILKTVAMDITYVDGVQHISVCGEDVTSKLRENHVSKAASDVSKHPCVRIKMVELQRTFAANHDVVLDGRDIGTYVLPDTPYKFFLTATPEERARRRLIDLKNAGQEADFNVILEEIKQRDYNDSHRDFAPLKQADDAVFVDSSDMTIDEVADFIIAKL